MKQLNTELLALPAAAVVSPLASFASPGPGGDSLATVSGSPGTADATASIRVDRPQLSPGDIRRLETAMVDNAERD